MFPARSRTRALSLGRHSCWSQRRCCCLAFALLALSLHKVRVPVSARLDAHLAAPPARLAHLLADFSYRHAGSAGAWALEDEASNYTSWRYSVLYSCGTRCSGRALVEAHEEALGPAHGVSARDHTVRVHDSRCVRPPVLPWPQLCEESESEVRVSAADAGGAGGAGHAGSLVSERATAWCGVWRAVRGACERDLRDQLEERMRRLRERTEPHH